MNCRLIVPLVALLATPPAAAQQSAGEPPAAPDPVVLSGPAEVVDGDTIKIDGARIRLFGIDAPEMQEWPWGPRARSALEDLTDGRTVTCLQRDTDRYDRPVATCATAETPDLAEALIAAGHAITYRRFTTGTELHAPYLAAERRARDAGLGPAPTVEQEPRWLRIMDRFQAGTGALIGALAGLGAIVLGVLYNARKTRERDNRIRGEDRSSLAEALAGEIEAAKSLLERRDMVCQYEEVIALLEEGASARVPRFSISDDHFVVYRANAADLGLLPAPLPRRVAGWYGLATSFSETMNNLTDEAIRHATAGELGPRIQEYLVDDLKDLLVTGADLVDLLERVRDGRSLPSENRGD